MKILIVTQYFWPENFRINDLVSGLGERGHEVVVLTGQPNYPSGRFFTGYGWCKPQHESHAGAEIIRVPLLPRGKGGWVRLALNYLSFVVTGCWGVMFRLSRQQQFNAIFVFQTSPVTVGIPAALAAWRFNAPILFWVLDLWPQSLSAVGAIRSPWVLKQIGALARWIYQHCSLILVSSKSFVPEIARCGIPVENIRYFPNWGEVAIAGEGARYQIPQLPDGFIVMFAGNVGSAQDFPAILDAATMLKSRKDIRWVIVGDGRLAAWAKDEVNARGLDDAVIFLGQHPLEAMPFFFAEADALLVTLKAEPVFSMTVPGKLQSYLASGKPILAMLDGEGARVVSESESGIACAAGDSASLAKAVTHLAELPSSELEKMGQCGKAYFSNHFARERVFDHLDVWLAEVTEKH